MNASAASAAGKGQVRKRAAQAPASAAAISADAESVSEQVTELLDGIKGSLKRLGTLIENRSLWADGVEGCREAVTVLGQAREKLESIGEGSQSLESHLATASAEIKRWGEMHAELTAVERALRAEVEEQRAAVARQREGLNALSAGNQTLRAECEQHRKRSGEYETAIARELELRTECDRLRALLRDRDAKLSSQDDLIARARSLAEGLASALRSASGETR